MLFVYIKVFNFFITAKLVFLQNFFIAADILFLYQMPPNLPLLFLARHSLRQRTRLQNQGAFPILLRRKLPYNTPYARLSASDTHRDTLEFSQKARLPSPVATRIF
jgi:hypothetical protein